MTRGLLEILAICLTAGTGPVWYGWLTGTNV